jgi:HEAT repeat protein
VSNEARQILVQASSNPWAALRAHALEASIGHPSLLSEMAPKALVDENRGVRFVACMSIAEMRDARFNPLVAPLLSDPSASVRAAAMLALSRGGQRVNFTPLADMLADNDPEIRANAYLVLGELGNESAIPLIRESLGRGMKLVNPLRVRLVDLAAAEALVKLGDEKEVEPIRAALFAPPEQGELTIVACDSVRRLKDEVARPMLERIVSARGSAERSPEIRLAACRALHALGSPGAPLAVAKEYAQHPDARIRAQSTVLLGEIGSPDARALLSGLLHDADPTVQVAAAGGLDPEAP